jgi:hypothetical protein
MSSKFYVWGEKAKSIPQKAGVYGLYNEDYELIYVGESLNLKETFEEYLETDFSQDLCKLATKYYNRQFTPNPQKRKKEILEEYKSKYGTYPKCNILIREEQKMPPEKTVLPDKGFHFYEEIAKPTGKVATSLKDFTLKLKEIPVISIEFHQKRGDFAKWIQKTFGAPVLASAIERIKVSGEDLRKQLIETITHPEKATMANCPKCGATIPPTKTWSMTGKVVKTGIRPKLTLGYYKCPYCGKSFRRVLAKEKIRAS